MTMVLSLLLFLGASLGHFALILRSHNWFYGSPLGRKTIDVLQLLHGLLFLAGPVGFWWAFGFDPLALFHRPVECLGLRFLAGYVALCWLAGFVFVPLVTVQRLLRRCPPLLSEARTTILVEQLAGRSLAGNGKHHRLARLPGNQVCQLDLTVKTLKLRIPPAWDGLTILHLSDFHFCGTPEREYHERVVDLCMAWQPDLIALTGDYVDSLTHHAWITPVLGKLQAREAKLAILGNHDYWYEPEKVREQLRQLGYRTPANSWDAIEVRGQPLIVIGHEGPWLKTAPDLSNCPANVFRLCLSHTPDNIAWARKNGVDLMLSGHVHGGQIRLPLIGSLVVPSLYGRRYDSGTYLEERTLLHVSRGLAGKHPLRYNCRPEATLLVLRST